MPGQIYTIKIISPRENLPWHTSCIYSKLLEGLFGKKSSRPDKPPNLILKNAANAKYLPF